MGSSMTKSSMHDEETVLSSTASGLADLEGWQCSERPCKHSGAIRVANDDFPKDNDLPERLNLCCSSIWIVDWCLPAGRHPFRTPMPGCQRQLGEIHRKRDHTGKPEGIGANNCIQSYLIRRNPYLLTAKSPLGNFLHSGHNHSPAGSFLSPTHPQWNH